MSKQKERLERDLKNEKNRMRGGERRIYGKKEMSGAIG